MLKCVKSILFSFILILFIPFEALSTTCCVKEVATEVYAPYDTDSKVYKQIFGFSREFLNGAWDQVFRSSARWRPSIKMSAYLDDRNQSSTGNREIS
jgi:hypothetical protein